MLNKTNVNTIKLAHLLDKGSWTNDEKKWVLQYIEENEGNPYVSELFELMSTKFESNASSDDKSMDEEKERILSVIHQKIYIPYQSTVKLNRSMKWRYIAIASSFVLFVSTSLLLFLKKEKNAMTVHTEVVLKHGNNNAVLTLADGKKVILESVEEGTLFRNANVAIVKKNGVLSYSNASNTGEVAYHTLTTAKGNQYQLLLADGSKIWLNASSSIRFPTIFNNKERRIEITGEAYFEIAHNKARPFIAKIISGSGKDGGEVEVLGTRFTIHAYDDEATVKTTLLEGAIRFRKNTHNKLLIPGQQVSVNYQSENLEVATINTGMAVAWTNGEFQFNNDNVEHVMRQIARWYNAEVVYEGGVSGETFSGTISRSSNIDQVLKILEAGGITAKINGQKIIVIK